MFSYYGSKSKIVNHYPRPTESKIIEPFCGSARYSLKYFDRDVLLIDKYEVVIKIWQWLQKCTPNDILSLPKYDTGIDLRECNLSDEERMFLGMCAGIASISPRNKISPFAGQQNGRKNKFKHIANNLYKIKHWTIKQGCYTEIPNEKATYFIDAPYQFGGHAYIENKIDFENLAIWTKERNGQIIVCENEKANWLPFEKLVSFRGANQKFTTEVIWTNFEYKQPTLF